MHSHYFPLFIDMTGKEFLVYGAGRIAARRVETLLRFGASVTLIAPELSEEIREVIRQCEAGEFNEDGGKIREVRMEAYRQGSIREDADFVLAATDDEEANEKIGRECRHKEIPVNIASDQAGCDYYFPAVIDAGDLTIGLTSGGKDHGKVREAAARIREMLL